MTIIAVDFDETLCCRSNPNNILFQALIERQKQGCKIILNTCRNGERLNEAVDFCKHHGLLFDAVNSNLPFVIKWLGYDPRKIFASIYLDDKNINIQKFINDSFLENRSINLVTKTGHVCSAQELRYYSELKARKHEYRNADDYIQDPETGLMQGRRPSSSNGTSAGLTEGGNSGKLTSSECSIHSDKMSEYCLKVGSKHSDEFFDVGYKPDDSVKLNNDIIKQFDMSKAKDNKLLADGAERFSIFMNLGVAKTRSFRTVWQKDKPSSKARFITAHREDEK